MSIKVFGVAEFSNQKLPLAKKMESCFFVVEKATENKLGTRLGCNVASNFRDKFKNFIGIIPIELTDNPLVANAESLFAGHGKTYVGKANVDSDESLSSRMMRIQNFICEVLKIEHINKITLDINVKDGDQFETIEIGINDFCRKMLELYEREENWTPTVRIRITK